MMERRVCRHCGRSSGGQEQRVPRSYLLIGEGDLRQEDRADAPNRQRPKSPQSHLDSQSTESIEKSDAEENREESIQNERPAKLSNLNYDL